MVIIHVIAIPMSVLRKSSDSKLRISQSWIWTKGETFSTERSKPHVFLQAVMWWQIKFRLHDIKQSLYLFKAQLCNSAKLINDIVWAQTIAAHIPYNSEPFSRESELLPQKT